MATIPRAGGFAKAASVFNTQDWTPTFTNLTKGTGATEEGWYATLGDLVFCGYRLVLGTSPAVSGVLYFDLPVTADIAGVGFAFGSWSYRDDSAVTMYSGAVQAYNSSGATGAFAGAWDGTSPKARITTGVPVTAAVSDVLSFQLVYRAV